MRGSCRPGRTPTRCSDFDEGSNASAYMPTAANGTYGQQASLLCVHMFCTPLWTQLALRVCRQRITLPSQLRDRRCECPAVKPPGTIPCKPDGDAVMTGSIGICPDQIDGYGPADLSVGRDQPHCDGVIVRACQLTRDEVFKLHARGHLEGAAERPTC
jgi:hypothetical protein